MKKPLFALFVMAIFLLGIGFAKPVTADTLSFSDVKTHWAKPYITNLSNPGFLKGYPDKTFKPDKSMTRAEFTTALISCMKISVSTPTSNSFTDTGKHWSNKYVAAAVKQGIIERDEYPQGLFKPDSNIKRSEAAAMLVRALGKDSSEGTISFKDANQVEESMYRDFIKTAFDLGLISGFPDGTFQPFRDMTRAQVCTVLTKFLDINKGTTPSTVGTRTLKNLAIGEYLYTIDKDSITFNKGSTDINVKSLSVTNDALQVNGSNVFALNSTSNNPDVIINNTRYIVKRMVVNGDTLLISSEVCKINQLQIGTKKFDSHDVKLYVNATDKDNDLSDMEIIDETTVQINNKNYNLSKDIITIEAQNNYYSIKKINFINGDAVPQLSKTVPVVIKGLSLEDISAIYVGNKTLDLDEIKRISFEMNGQRYRSSEITLDASVRFYIDSKVVAVDKVKMIIDDVYYQISHVQLYKGKSVFYLQKITTADFAIFNGVHQDLDDIEILKGSTVYDMDQVVVTELNVLRISGKRYALDNTIKCRVDSKLWDMSSINWDTKLKAITIKATVSKTGLYQPSKYIFYDDHKRKIKDGADNTVNIYANRKWLNFNQIIISDPSHFTYNGTNYDLIGSQVRIEDDKYEIDDSTWRSSDRAMLLYLQ